MGKIKAYIVDDEKENIDILRYFIDKFCKEIEIVGFSHKANNAISAINDKKPQLIFLDIMLDEGTGFDLLEAINYRNYNVIFITAFNEYAIKAFKYNAIDYVLKPIIIEELTNAVDKVTAKISQDPQVLDDANDFFLNGLDFVPIPSMKKIDFIKHSDITYLKSDGRYTVVNLVDDDLILATKNLGDFERSLASKGFYRIHHSYIVNLAHVTAINKAAGNYCELINGIALPIAKRRQERLHEYLGLKS